MNAPKDKSKQAPNPKTEKAASPKKLLWIDDEIVTLKPHILFLEGKGYSVTCCSSGEEAIKLVRSERFELALLDEMMPGMDGLTTLEELKVISPHLPVIMVTKSEEESLMEEAIGQKIDDYLTKPLNPSQALMAIKRILDSRKIRSDALGKRYIADINRFNQKLYGPVTPEDWFDAASILSEWDIELSEFPDTGLWHTHAGTHTEWNIEFTKYVEKNYVDWMKTPYQEGTRPLLPPDVIDHTVMPELTNSEKLVFVVIDCMRLDQWVALEPLLSEYFDIERKHFYSLLPTATPYARNALFSGLFPDEINERYPDIWSVEDAGSLNRFEEEMINAALKERDAVPKSGIKYAKVFNNAEMDTLYRKISDFYPRKFSTIVVNFLDIMSHGRSNNMILKEIAGNESAFRSITLSWFTHSTLFKALKDFASHGHTVIITTDHGSKLCHRGALAHGKRDTSTTLRYKHGVNLNCDPKQGIIIRKPEEYRLPKPRLATTYIIAKEDYYFVYPNRYNEHVRQFQNSFQHGGLSLEEMIIPLSVLRPR